MCIRDSLYTLLSLELWHRNVLSVPRSKRMAVADRLRFRDRTPGSGAPVVESHPLASESGGLSGRPLTETAAKTVAHIHAETGGALPIIGVGGILDSADAARLFDAGASLVQIYTGLIYRGPGLVRQINRGVR